MTYYENRLTKEALQTQFVELKKTSRQIAREYHISRKIVNMMLLEIGLITAADLEPGDLP
jgi:Zn-dependent peptidase ImmA (M78 family)